MKTIFSVSILCLVLLTACENYVGFLGDNNQPPQLRLVDKEGELVSSITDELKLPSDIKQERPDFYTITATAMDPEGQMQDISARIESGLGELSSIEYLDNGRLEFTYKPDPGTFGLHKLQLIATDNLGARTAVTIDLDVYVNRLPVASFTLRKSGSNAPFEYFLDARQSADPDKAAGGGIVKLEWTIGGQTFTDPLVDKDGNFDGDMETLYVFPNAGNYTITLVVIDNDGGRSTATLNQSFTIN